MVTMIPPRPPKPPKNTTDYDKHVFVVMRCTDYCGNDIMSVYATKAHAKKQMAVLKKMYKKIVHSFTFEIEKWKVFKE